MSRYASIPIVNQHAAAIPAMAASVMIRLGRSRARSDLFGNRFKTANRKNGPITNRNNGFRYSRYRNRVCRPLAAYSASVRVQTSPTPRFSRFATVAWCTPWVCRRLPKRGEREDAAQVPHDQVRVLAAVRGVEDGVRIRRGAPSGVALQDRVHQHRQPAAVGADDVDRDLARPRPASAAAARSASRGRSGRPRSAGRGSAAAPTSSSRL